MNKVRVLTMIFINCAVMFFSSCAFPVYEGMGEEQSPPAEEQSETGGGELDETGETAGKPDVSAGNSVSSGDGMHAVSGSFLWDGGYAYGFEKLAVGERLWYADIADALGTMTDNAKLSEEGLKAGLTEKDVDRIFQVVLDDHPELFYVDGYSYTRYTRGDVTVAIEFTGKYNCTSEEAGKRRKAIEKEVDRLLTQAPTEDDDYAKIKYTYETLILNTDYDMEAPNNQNIYSVFVDKRSVCQGYAKAFQYLMNRMGVKCTLVQGAVRETGEGHAWNLLEADGDFYYVDATWGDISYRSEQDEETEKIPLGISYEYLCITTERLLRTHEPDMEKDYPQCTALKDNYYVKEGAYFTEYDRDQMTKLVEDRVFIGGEVRDEAEIMISLCCADETCYEEMYRALITEKEIFDYLAGSGISSFIYSTGEEQLTLTFFLMTSTR